MTLRLQDDQVARLRFTRRVFSLRVLVTIVAMTVLSGALIFHALTQYIEQDEEQYVAAAHLFLSLRLYADFLYLQPPVYPLVNAAAMATFSDGTGTFLVARMVSAALSIGSLFLVLAIARRLAGNMIVALVVGALFATAPIMLLAFGSARNDIMPISFGLAGVWLTLRGLERGDRVPLQFGIAGLCMALAVGSKVSAAFVPATAVLYLTFRRRSALGPLIAGGALGSVPTLYFAATRFEPFQYGVFTYHLTAPFQFYSEIGQEHILTWPYRIKQILSIWLSEPSLIFAALAVALVVVIATLSRQSSRPSESGCLVLLLTIAAVPFVFLPNPSDARYLQPMVPFVLLSCATLYPIGRHVLSRPALFVLIAIAGVSLALQAGRLSFEAAGHMGRPLWTPGEAHAVATMAVRHLRETNHVGPVATMYPILILDGGGKVMPQFASSLFVFRSAHHMPAERVLRLNAVSIDTIDTVFAKAPPTAVLVGHPGDWPLIRWAERNGYIEAPAFDGWRGGPYVEDIWRPRLLVAPTPPPK